MEYGEKELFSIKNLDVYSRDKIGIIGQNGVGKTTLMEIINGNIMPTKGVIEVKVPHVYVPQLDEGMDGEISKLSGNEWNVPENAKSGGEITRRKLAKAFSCASNLLLCDEPTSNLDQSGIDMLEKSLCNYDGSIIIISHDRAMLDKVCNKIWELDRGRLTEYHGTYTDYRTQKELMRKNEWDEYDKYIDKKKQLESALTNRSSKAKSMKNPPKRMGNSEARLHRQDVRQRAGKVEQASKQIKHRLERLDVKRKPFEEASLKMSASFSKDYISKTAISVDNLNFAYGANTVLEDVSFSIKKGEHVAIAGDNGSGKSTLLNCIYNGYDAVKTAPGAKIGYFRQDLKNLNDNETVLSSIKKESMLPEHMIRIVLGRLGIKRGEVYKKIEVLSGGERCKVSLTKLICGGYPILLLDEPTNYLDIYVLEALEEMLSDFDGTIVLVSHDRYFRKKIADRNLVIRNHRILEERKATPAKQKKESTMLLEMEKAKLISKMTYPQKGDVIEALEERYREVCALLQSK